MKRTKAWVGRRHMAWAGCRHMALAGCGCTHTRRGEGHGGGRRGSLEEQQLLLCMQGGQLRQEVHQGA
eukprot:1148512-Pelagomonas_calceolata.AAC.2